MFNLMSNFLGSHQFYVPGAFLLDKYVKFPCDLFQIRAIYHLQLDIVLSTH